MTPHGHTREARPGQRRRERLSPLLALLVLLMGVLPPGTASAVSATLEPALAQAIVAAPGAWFPVIVTQQTAPGAAERRADETEVESAIRARQGVVRARLGIVNGRAATLRGGAIQALARHPRVRSISLDHRVVLHDLAVPTAAVLQSTETAAVGAPAVWATYGNQGAGVTVAVLDSGVRPGPDLPGAAFGADLISGGSSLGDGGGHGTHVAGIVAGTGALSGGAYMGIAPRARVLMVKVTTDDGRASYSSIIQGLQWVVSNATAQNIRVVNLSLGAPVVGSYADDPLVGAVEAAWFRGITVVVAAGNSGPGPGTITAPANDPYAVTVGALDDNQTAVPTDDVIPDWSARGPTLRDGFAKPDLVAPGRRIVSLRAPGSYLDTLMPDRRVGDGYFRLSGTSMAAPVVAGVAALVLAQNPRLRPDQVKYILERTARPLPGYGADAAGAGAVDALAAVQLAARGVGDRANRNLVPNSHFAAAVWPVVRTLAPVWRDPGYLGRDWTNGSWENVAWDNAAWENLAWENLAWENGSWENGSWENGSWENGGWDTADLPAPLP